MARQTARRLRSTPDERIFANSPQEVQPAPAPCTATRNALARLGSHKTSNTKGPGLTPVLKKLMMMNCTTKKAPKKKYSRTPPRLIRHRPTAFFHGFLCEEEFLHQRGPKETRRMRRTTKRRRTYILPFGPPPCAPANGRPGFPFGFLGAGGRLPKARRGRVFSAIPFLLRQPPCAFRRRQLPPPALIVPSSRR